MRSRAHRGSSAARHGGCRRRGHVGSPCPGVGPRVVSTRSPRPPLPLRLPAQRGAQLCGALRIRARRALALAQLKPGVEAAAHGERHAQTQRLARSAARRHPEVGRPARPALPPVKPVPHLQLVGLRRVDRRVSHQPRGVLAAPQRLDAAVGRAPARPEPHRQPAPVRGRG